MDESSAPVGPLPQPGLPELGLPEPAVASPWAAPGEPAAGFPPPPSTPETSVVIPEAPTRSHKGLIAAVAVLVVAALGVGGFFLLKGDDTVAYALDVAAQRAADAPGLTTHIETGALGQTVSIDGTVDHETGLLEMTMDMGGMLGTDAALKAVVDPATKTIYMSTEAFGEMISGITDKQWVKIDQKALAEAGQDGAVFDQLGSAGQIDAAALVDGAKKVTDLGLTTFEGEQVRHYEAVVAVKDVKGLGDLLEGQTAGLDAVLPDEITYDFYVTEDNELRRINYDLDLGVAKVEVDVTQHLLDTSPGIVAPPDDQVIDVSELG